MPNHHQNHDLVEARKKMWSKHIKISRNKSGHRSYKQIIEHHFNIHALMVVGDDGQDTDHLKIHIVPKSKMAHALKKQGLPPMLRKRDLGCFCQALSRTIDSLVAHLEP